MPVDQATLVLIAITLFAAVVNGALGYGFSSLTVPVALLFYTNRILNPALVLVEVVVNTAVLIINRGSLPKVWRRTLPILLGLVPGIAVGSIVLSHVEPGAIKLVTYAVVLPLILVQAAGFRKVIQSERTVGIPFGTGVGVLYSVTTISGPPLALMFNNQGYVKRDFRAALALVRIVESSVTAVAYYFLGLYSVGSGQVLLLIVPSVVIGLPLGAFLVGRIQPEVFRRVCMSFDAWVVGFGLSRSLIELKILAEPTGYAALLLTIAVDAALLVWFFRKQQRHEGSGLAFAGH